MKIAVVGTGYVGLVTGSYFANKGHDVSNLDIDESKVKFLNEGKIPFYEPGLHDFVEEAIKLGKLKFTTDYPEALKDSQFIFICVGTPTKDGEADLSFVESALSSIAKNLDHNAVIVGKSTMPFGIKDWVKGVLDKNSKGDIKIDWVVNPEFLAEGTAVYDMQNPSRIVIGGKNKEAVKKVAKLYSDLNCPIILTDTESASLIKYASNSFLATKISFINNVANIVDLVGADISDIAYGIGLDPRIGDKFLKAGVGYGGSCFPKDVLAFYKESKKLGSDFNLLKEVERINTYQPEIVIKKLEDNLGDLNGKTIAILGLSFKSDTDDLREAPSIKIIKLLLEKGVEVKGNDPIANENFRKLGLEVKVIDPVYEAVKDADALILVTEWKLYYGLDWGKIKSLMKGNLIIDGRNFLDKDLLKGLGFKYLGVGTK